MRAAEFTEDNFGISPRRTPRKGARHPRGHAPVQRYHTKQSEEQLDELSFLGSQCTKDCSGHRAGYEWYQRNQRTPASWSASFNKGAALRAAGK